jgi:hypothetical protein
MEDIRHGECNNAIPGVDMNEFVDAEAPTIRVGQSVSGITVIDLEIGKYSCKAHADQLPNGKSVGVAAMRCQEGTSTGTQPRYFDGVCDTEEDAIQHALAQIDLLVKNGDL